jgi:hypothetical protein
MDLKKLRRGVFTAILLMVAVATAMSQVPSAQHVVIVIDENRHLQQLGPQQLLRRNRASARARVHLVKSAGQLTEHLVHHGPDRAPRG